MLSIEQQNLEVRVQDAVLHISRITNTKALEAALEIGGYLLREFYGGEFDRFHARDGAEDATLRMIAAHPSMPLSASYLYSCVAVLEQWGQIPIGVASELSFSHHRRLLPVRGDRKRHLATRAVSEGWSVRRLSAEIKPEPSRRGGRPRKPVIQRCSDELERVLTRLHEADDHDASATLLGHLDPDEALALADEALGRATAVMNELRRVRALARRSTRLLTVVPRRA